MAPFRAAAIDLGASSGRVMLVVIGSGRMVLTEVYRFPNGPVIRGGKLCWDFGAIWDHVVAALRDHRLIVWSKHGILGRSDIGPINVVDLVEYAEMGALYDHLNTVAGYRSEGLSEAELRSVVEAFGVVTSIV